MPKIIPINHNDLIRKLKQFGFNGPFSGGKHLFMIKENIRLTIPNSHRKEVGVDLLKRILRQAGISTKEWQERS
ncbi:MAG TPA: type II toxin-antitoxin system HicA family toxin [Bacteroidetes bacterium]|nr:type II toxin-antitoxin system HicA family toxin [Bacteroidota bacterium]